MTPSKRSPACMTGMLYQDVNSSPWAKNMEALPRERSARDVEAGVCRFHYTLGKCGVTAGHRLGAAIHPSGGAWTRQNHHFSCRAALRQASSCAFMASESCPMTLEMTDSPTVAR